MSIGMDLPTAHRINTHMVHWYLHATSGIPEEAPSPLPYSLTEMLEAAAIVRNITMVPAANRQSAIGNRKCHITVDDRGIAALYVIHHFQAEPNEADSGEPILKFASPSGDAIRALLFLEFKGPRTPQSA